jgi:predicted Zn-dependent protease
MHNRILREHPVYENDAIRERVEEALRPLLDACRRRGVDYSVTVIDAPDRFAFSHLGGYVYLSRGMLELAADEAGLQFAIAHELAHLELEHDRPLLARQAAEERARSRSEGLVASRLLELGGHLYRHDDEREADAWTVETLRRGGLADEAILSFPRRYLASLGEQATSRSGSELSSPLAVLDRHGNRLAETRERLERLPDLLVSLAPAAAPSLAGRPSGESDSE